MKKIYLLVFLLLIAALGSIYFLVRSKMTDLPESGSIKNYTFTKDEKALYYKMFDKKTTLTGSEKTAEDILEKVNKSFKKDKKVFQDLLDLETINEDKILKAIYIMNFVSFSNYYGTPDRSEKEMEISQLFWDIGTSNCETNATLLAMLLEKEGYEQRIVCINGLSHGFNEVKFNNNWNVLDATTNIWINKGTEELLNGNKGEVKGFFLKELDRKNENYSNETNLSFLQVQMSGLGEDFKPIYKYNCIDLKAWKY